MFKERSLSHANMKTAPSSAEAWDKAAIGWHAHSALVNAWLQGITVQMLDAAQITSGSHVLDVAAGAGDQTLEIAQRVGQAGYVLATDISAPLLAFTRERAHAAGYAQIHTLRADAQALLPGKAVGFDAAVCRLGLMFCLSPVAALHSMHASLKAGGQVSGVVFGSAEHNPCLTVCLEIARRYAGLDAPTALHFAQPGGLLSLGAPKTLAHCLQRAGFTGITVQAVSAPFYAPTVAHYIAFIRSAAAPLRELLAPLPACVQQEAWAEMEQALEKFSTQQRWEGPNELLLYSAQR